MARSPMPCTPSETASRYGDNTAQHKKRLPFEGDPENHNLFTISESVCPVIPYHSTEHSGAANFILSVFSRSRNQLPSFRSHPQHNTASVSHDAKSTAGFRLRNGLDRPSEFCLAIKGWKQRTFTPVKLRELGHTQGVQSGGPRTVRQETDIVPLGRVERGASREAGRFLGPRGSCWGWSQESL